MHSAYSSVIDTFSFSIIKYVELVMGAIWNLFKIILMETDSNGNIIGFNFLGTCIVLILGLYLIVWAVSYLITMFTFGQTKDDLPKYSDIENESYWEKEFNNEISKNKINWKRAKYTRNQALLFRKRTENRLNEELRNKELKDMKRWKQDQQLKRYRKYYK